MTITETVFKTLPETGICVIFTRSTSRSAKLSAAKALARKPERVTPI